MLVGASLLVAFGAAVASVGQAFAPAGDADGPPNVAAYALVALTGVAIVAVGLWLAFAGT